MGIRNRLALVAVLALLLIGGPAFAGSRAVVDDTEPSQPLGVIDEPDPTSIRFVDCSAPSALADLALCDFMDRAKTLGYAGVTSEVFDRIELPGGDVGFVSRGLSASPLSACDDPTGKDCQAAGEAACKAAGKPGPGGTWKFFYILSDGKVNGACSGTCPGGGAWYVTCVVPK